MIYPTQLFVGKVRALPVSGRPSGIYKEPVLGTAEISWEGFVDDEQADRRVHGGPDKAIHQFPASHYAALAARFPDVAHLLVPGSMGENISCELTEADVRVGDIWQFGTAQLQVCQPRKPCWKIDERFAQDGMAVYIDETGLTGWYWRVLQTGHAVSGETLNLVTRQQDAPTLHEAMTLCAAHRPDIEKLRALSLMPELAENWREKMRQRIEWLEKNT